MTNYSTIEKAVQSIFAAGDTRGLIDPMYHAAKAGDFFKLVKKREDVDAMLSYYIVLNRIDANATETAARFLGDIPMLGKVSAKGQKIQGMGNYTADLFSILLHYMENPDGINAKSRHEQLNKPYLQRMQQEKQNEIETLGPQAVMHFMEFMHNVVPLENASEFLATQKEISDFAMNRSGDRKQMHEDFWNYFTGLEVLSKDDSTFVGRKIALKLHSAALPILSIYGTDTLSTVSSLILKYENMREPWFANKIIDTLYAFGRSSITPMEKKREGDAILSGVDQLQNAFRLDTQLTLQYLNLANMYAKNMDSPSMVGVAERIVAKKDDVAKRHFHQELIEKIKSMRQPEAEKNTGM